MTALQVVTTSVYSALLKSRIPRVLAVATRFRLDLAASHGFVVLAPKCKARKLMRLTGERQGKIPRNKSGNMKDHGWH